MLQRVVSEMVFSVLIIASVNVSNLAPVHIVKTYLFLFIFGAFLGSGEL